MPSRPMTGLLASWSPCSTGGMTPPARSRRWPLVDRGGARVIVGSSSTDPDRDRRPGKALFTSREHEARPVSNLPIAVSRVDPASVLGHAVSAEDILLDTQQLVRMEACIEHSPDRRLAASADERGTSVSLVDLGADMIR